MAKPVKFGPMVVGFESLVALEEWPFIVFTKTTKSVWPVTLTKHQLVAPSDPQSSRTQKSHQMDSTSQTYLGPTLMEQAQRYSFEEGFS